MAVNRYTDVNYDAPISSRVPTPLDMIYKVGASKQAQQDKAELERLDLLGKQWNMLPQDLAYSKKVKDELTGVVNEFAGKDFSSPAVKTEWIKKKQELANRFGGTGDIGNIQANYDAYKAYEKNILDKSKELGWSSDEIRQHLKTAKDSFKGTVNPDDKSFNYFTGQGVANYVDPNEWASKNLKDVAADTGIEGLKKYSNLNEVTTAFRSGEIEHKDYDKIMNSLAARAQGDSKLKASLEQEGLFRGKKGWSNFIKEIDEKGNVIPNDETPFGRVLSGISYGAAYQKEKENYMKVVDPLLLYKKKKALEEEDLQKQIKFTIQGLPTDPNNPTNTDAGVNTILKTNDTGVGKYWEFKDGKLITSKKQGSTKSVVNIDGKEYDVNHLPEGYNYAVSDISRSKSGTESIPQNMVIGPDGKALSIKSKPVTQDDLKQAYKSIIPIARRLGVTSNKPEDLKNAVEKYYTEANNFQMNFTSFDSGTQAALSSIFGAKTKTDSKGNMTIVDPGQLSFSTIKGLDGKPINVEDLELYKAQLLNGANIIGPAQSLSNKNYQPGDMYIQGKDPETGSTKIFIMNTNNQSFNAANAPATILTQSIDNYVNGNGVADSPQLNKINEKFGGEYHKFTAAIPDGKGNIYASYVDASKKDSSGKPILEIGTVKIDKDGTPNKVRLDVANLELTQNFVAPMLPSFNIKNFDRGSKATTYDEVDEIVNQALEDN